MRGLGWGPLVIALGCGGPDHADPPDADPPDAVFMDAAVIPDAALRCPTAAPRSDDTCAPVETPKRPDLRWRCPPGWSSVEPIGCRPGPPPAPTLDCVPPLEGQAASTRYVDAAAVGGDGSAERPFPTIAEAIEAAERSPQVRLISLAPGTYVEDVDLFVEGLRLAGACPAQVRVEGTVRVAVDGHLTGVHLVAPPEAPALVSGTSTLRLERVRIDGGLEVRGSVGAEHVIIEALGTAVEITRGSFRCAPCAIHADEGSAVVALGPDTAVHLSGTVRGGRAATTADAADDVPAVTVRGQLDLVDAVVEGRGDAIEITGAATLERVGVRLLGETPRRRYALLAWQHSRVTVTDAAFALGPRGAAVLSAVGTALTVRRLTVEGDAADPVGSGVLAIGNEVLAEDVVIRDVGQAGFWVERGRGTVHRLTLSGVGGAEGVPLSHRHGLLAIQAALDVRDLHAEGVAGAAALAFSHPEPTTLEGVWLGGAPIRYGVAALQATIEVSDLHLGAGVVEGVSALEHGRVTVDGLTSEGAGVALMAREAGTVEARDFLIRDSVEAGAVAHDGRLGLEWGHFRDNPVAVVRRLAASVRLTQVSFAGNAERDRCELVCTDRPASRGAPSALPD